MTRDLLKGEYTSWRGMVSRCVNPRAENYPRYGGRGIEVCGRWRLFRNFFMDMGPRPSGMTLDRIDNDGNYEPSNCRWLAAGKNTRQRRKYIGPLLENNRFFSGYGPYKRPSNASRRAAYARKKHD